MNNNYDDILYHARPASHHPPMPRADRSAQFAPFAALSGYDACLQEASRLTEDVPELDESEKEALDQVLQQLRNPDMPAPYLRVTYFRPDDRKEGGARLTVSGQLLRLDSVNRLLLLTDGSAIPVDRLLQLEISREMPE